MSKYDNAYYAGLIDGDGCIGSHCQNSTRVDGTKLKIWDVQVQVGIKVSNYALSKVQSIWGGSLETDKYGTLRWVIRGKLCEKFLKDIYPFLVIKKKQAKVALKIRKTKEKKGGLRRLPKNVQVLRENLISELKSLHHKKGFAMRYKKI